MNSVYVIGESRTNADNAITKIYNSFYMAFEIEDKTGIILAVNCTHTLPLTESFVSRMFVGKNFLQAEEWLEDELNRRYAGSSRKAILVSYRDALKRYRKLLELE